MNNITSLNWLPVGPAPCSNPGPGQGGNAGRANSVCADPTNSAVIYLASAGGGIWKTSNALAGAVPVWQPVTDDQPSLQTGGVHSMIVHPANHNIVQACVYYSGAGVLRSEQAGIPGSWVCKGNSLFDGHMISGIAVNPANIQETFVATDMGLFHTTDSGQNWQSVDGGLPGSGVSDVIFSRYNPLTLLVTVFGNSGPDALLNGIYKSSDGGKTWNLLTDLPNQALSGQYTSNSTLQTVNGAIQVDTGSGGTFYASLLVVGPDPKNPGALGIIAVQRFKSMDNGSVWTELAASPGNLENRSWHQLIAVDPRNDMHVFVNDSYSLYESNDGGATWAQAHGNWRFDWVSVNFDASGKVLACSDQGLFRYDPGTQVWESLIGNLQITSFYTITVNSQTICGVAQDQYAGMASGNDQPNATWQYLQSGGETGKILLPPANATFAYLYNPLSDNNYDLVWRAFCIGNLNPTENWTPILTQNIYGSGNYNAAYTVQKAFVSDNQNPGRLLVGADQVYETTQAASLAASPIVWNPIGPPPVKSVYVTAIAIAPSAPETIYVATNDQHVWMTSNNGSSWNPCDTGLFSVANGAIQAICVDPNDASHAFAVSGQWWGTSKVWELSSGQHSWTSRSGPNNLTVYAIVVDWQYAQPCLFIGTDRGVYVSANLGAAWSNFGITTNYYLTLPKAQVFDLQSGPISATENLIAAATYGRGAFEILSAPSTISGGCYNVVTSPFIRKIGVPGVTITLKMTNVTQGGFFGDGTMSSFSVITGNNGSYQFANVPPGVYAISSTPPPGVILPTDSIVVYVNGSTLTEVDFIHYIPTLQPPKLPRIPGLKHLNERTPVMQPPWGEE